MSGKGRKARPRLSNLKPTKPQVSLITVGLVFAWALYKGDFESVSQTLALIPQVLS